jgi:hypothetical protein
MREINWNEPLSEDDKAWLRQRDRHAEIEANEDRFSSGRSDFKVNDDDAAKIATEKDKLVSTEGTGTPAAPPELAPDDYDSWKVAELREEAGNREPAIDLTGVTVKADIIAALRTWDAAHPELIKE